MTGCDTTRLLLADPGRGVTGDELRAVRDRLVAGIGAASGDLPPGKLVEVTVASIRRARSHPTSVGSHDAPFTWKPVFARRSLGLAAVQASLDGRFRAPAAAVAPLADRAMEEWRHSGRRTFHWEPWFAGLGPGARAVVLAEAVTWATPLWTAVQWAAVGSRVHFGGADDLWTCPAPRTIRLKGRCEARLGIGSTEREHASRAAFVMVSVAPGTPTADADEELAFLALVSALAPGGVVPARVLGLWPDAGNRHVVEIDAELLGRAAERVVSTVADIADARTQERSGRPEVTALAAPPRL